MEIDPEEAKPFPKSCEYTCEELREKCSNQDLIKGIERFTDDHKVWVNPEHAGFEPDKEKDANE